MKDTFPLSVPPGVAPGLLFVRLQVGRTVWKEGPLDSRNAYRWARDGQRARRLAEARHQDFHAILYDGDTGLAKRSRHVVYDDDDPNSPLEQRLAFPVAPPLN